MCRIIDQNIKKCVFDSLDFQNFPGEHAPGPPRKARAAPSPWSLRDHSLNHIISQVSRLQLSKSWQVWNEQVESAGQPDEKQLRAKNTEEFDATVFYVRSCSGFLIFRWSVESGLRWRSTYALILSVGHQLELKEVCPVGCPSAYGLC